jgi:NAD(P)-dependent dehydrogenase (short-subunit alcohol dehydrogenase family)
MSPNIFRGRAPQPTSKFHDGALLNPTHDRPNEKKCPALPASPCARRTQKFLLDAGINRYGKPEEIADLMAFLVSPAARRMTGSVLRMDGGEGKSV